MPKRHKVTIEAPGAKKIGVQQVNNGGRATLKVCNKATCTFKTKKRQAGKPVTGAALLDIKILWSDEAGGIETHEPLRYAGSDQTVRFLSPVERAQLALADLTAGGAASDDVKDSAAAAVSLPPGAEGWVAGGQLGSTPPGMELLPDTGEEADGPSGWVLAGVAAGAAGLAALVGVAVKRLRRAA